MSLYLQRLARPSPPPGAPTRAGEGWAKPASAQAGLARPGGHDFEHEVEAGGPGGRQAMAPPGLGERTDSLPAQALDIPGAVTEYVNHWLAGPGDRHGTDEVPLGLPAAGAADRAGGAEAACSAALSRAWDIQHPLAGAVAPATTLGSADAWTAASTVPPSNRSLADPISFSAPTAGLTAAQVMVTASAPPGGHPARPSLHARSPATASPIRAPARPPSLASSSSSSSRVSQAARATPPLEVHIGSISLTVKAPPAANTPPTASTAHSGIAPSPPWLPAPAVPGPGAARAQGAPADALRFSPARHHLRWS